jgi:hypothetical protein
MPASARADIVSMLDVAVVGAGPYGLSCAAHLRSCDVTVFGETMSFWRDHMPEGMFLRSPAAASSLAAPRAGLRLEDYEREQGLPALRPVPLATFLDYGRWFERRAAPQPDPRAVAAVMPESGAFRLTLGDGDELLARNVVVAAGIEPFARRPPEFERLASELVSHSVDHDRLDEFRGRRVVVVGGGQSSIESAALLHEVGADVVVVARCNRVNWLVRSGRLHRAGKHEAPALRAVGHRPGGRQLARRAPERLPPHPAPRAGPARRAGDPTRRVGLAAPSDQRRPDPSRSQGRGGERAERRRTPRPRRRLRDRRRSRPARDGLPGRHLALPVPAGASRRTDLARRWVSEAPPGLRVVDSRALLRGRACVVELRPLFRFVAGTSWSAPRVAEALGALRRTPAARPREVARESSRT